MDTKFADDINNMETHIQEHGWYGRQKDLPWRLKDDVWLTSENLSHISPIHHCKGHSILRHSCTIDYIEEDFLTRTSTWEGEASYKRSNQGTATSATYLVFFSFCSLYEDCSCQVSSRKLIQVFTTFASTLHVAMDFERPSSWVGVERKQVKHHLD